MQTYSAAPPPVRLRLPLARPRVTYGLLGLIGAVFGLQLLSQWALGGDMVAYYGAKVNALIAQGELWRLITPIFVHGSLLHVGFNTYALYVLGRQVETLYGWQRFTVLFFVSGLAGTVFSLLLTPAPSVGASGAIFGLIGAEAVFMYRNRRLLGESAQRRLLNIVSIAALNLFLGLQGGIDNWAHLGGLVGGVALGWIIGPLWTVPATLIGLSPTVTAEDQQPFTLKRWLWVMLVCALLGFLTLLGIARQ